MGVKELVDIQEGMVVLLVASLECMQTPRKGTDCAAVLINTHLLPLLHVLSYSYINTRTCETFVWPCLSQCCCYRPIILYWLKRFKPGLSNTCPAELHGTESSRFERCDLKLWVSYSTFSHTRHFTSLNSYENVHFFASLSGPIYKCYGQMNLKNNSKNVTRSVSQSVSHCLNNFSKGGVYDYVAQYF